FTYTLRPSVVERPWDAHLLQQSHGGAIARGPEPGAQRHGAGRRVFIFGRPGALARRDGIVQVGDERGRREAGFERRGVDKRFERRTWLTFGLHRPVESTVVEIAAADHRAYVAGCGIHRDQSGLQRTLIAGLSILGGGPQRLASGVDRFERLVDGCLGGDLLLHVDRREDAQTALVYALPAEPIDQLATHLFLEILAVRFLRAQYVGELHRRQACFLPRGVIDRAIVQH